MPETRTTDTTTVSTPAVQTLQESPPARIGADESGDHSLTIFGLLALVMLGSAGSLRLETGNPGSPPPSPATINPNVAPWSELTILPRIGESTGKEIVRYRDAAAQTGWGDRRDRAFTCAADLAGVRGIGPKTVRRMAPYLRFDGP